MDDFFQSTESVQKALALQQQLVKMLELGGFRLTKWISSEKAAMKHIPETERAPSVKVVGGEIVLPIERALGITWNTETDSLLYQVKDMSVADTRRKVLSVIASLVDPIGFLAPFLVRAKVFLQQIWNLGIGWDVSLPPEFMKEWSKWLDELHSLSEFSVRRFYRHVTHKPIVIQLHVFGDTSERAFCSVSGLLQIRLLRCSSQVCLCCCKDPNGATETAEYSETRAASCSFEREVSYGDCKGA